MLEPATERADEPSRALITAAQSRATTALSGELQRLVDLQGFNHPIRHEERALARGQSQHTTTAITQARLRLDALRLIVEGPVADDEPDPLIVIEAAQQPPCKPNQAGK
jgi:ATP-dependent helicase HepA